MSPLSFERLKYILFFAGLCCFALAGILSAVLPVGHLSKIPYKALEEIVRAPSEDWLDLGRRYPEAMKKHYGEATAATFEGETPNKDGRALIAYVQWLGSWATREALTREASHAAAPRIETAEDKP